MNVGEVCTREVVFVSPATSVRDVGMRMREYNVGSVVVIDNDTGRMIPVGIVTDRDIAVAVLAEDVDPNNLSAKDVMMGELITANVDEGIWETVQRMSDCGVRRLPVTDKNGSLVGLLSVDDLIELLAESMNNLVSLIRHGRQREQRRQI
jgi:CBS domain-containing protein